MAGTPLIFSQDIEIRGGLKVTGSLTGANRASIAPDLLEPHLIPLSHMRVWDDFKTAIGTAASDDLGIADGTFGTGMPYIVSRDLNALGATTGYCRFLYQVPENYNDNFRFRITAGMVTSVASVSATVDLQVYLQGEQLLITGSDICTTAACDINADTQQDAYSFDLDTTTGLDVGSILDCRIALTANSATASSHFAAIRSVEALFDVRG